MALNHLWENLLDMKSLSHWIISFMTLLDHHLFSTVRLEFSKRQNFEKMTNFNRRKSVFKDSVKRGKNLDGSYFLPSILPSPIDESLLFSRIFAKNRLFKTILVSYDEESRLIFSRSSEFKILL